MRSYHAFEDKSRRRPYLCGVCNRDITDPYHQPVLSGILIVERPEPEPEAAEEPEPRRDERQMGLFA